MVKVISYVMKAGAPLMEVFEDTMDAVARHKELSEDDDCVQLKIANATFVSSKPAKRTGGFSSHIACDC